MPIIGNQELSIYVHFPFCSKKCPYCHFYVLPNKNSLEDLFLEALLLECEQNLDLLTHKTITSIYFGGGTPSLFPLNYMEKVIEKLKKLLNFDSEIEFTLEANPEKITRDQAQFYLDLGFNRISLGVQSFDDHLLAQLGRAHSAAQAQNTIETLYDVGFQNISIDLMYDVPNQTLSTFVQSIYKIAHLPVTHVSLYNLTFEPHTVFFKYRKELQAQIPSETESLKMYQLAQACLQEFGFNQYEISAFAKNELESKHNTGYWTNREFLGLGPSAFSYMQGRRYRNYANIHRYIKSVKQNLSTIDFEETLSEEERTRELMALRLRYLKPFQPPFKWLSEEIKLSLETLIKKGWLQHTTQGYALTSQGILFHDSVAEEII